MPTAYVMGMLTITNPEGMGPYMAAVPETIAEDGSFVRHMGEKLYTEGDPGPVSVVIEFPDAATARAWKSADNYKAILPMRLDNSEGPLVICDGVE